MNSEADDQPADQQQGDDERGRCPWRFLTPRPAAFWGSVTTPSGVFRKLYALTRSFGFEKPSAPTG